MLLAWVSFSNGEQCYKTVVCAYASWSLSCNFTILRILMELDKTLFLDNLLRVLNYFSHVSSPVHTAHCYTLYTPPLNILSYPCTYFRCIPFLYMLTTFIFFTLLDCIYCPVLCYMPYFLAKTVNCHALIISPYVHAAHCHTLCTFPLNMLVLHAVKYSAFLSCIYCPLSYHSHSSPTHSILPTVILCSNSFWNIHGANQGCTEHTCVQLEVGTVNIAKVNRSRMLKCY